MLVKESGRYIICRLWNSVINQSDKLLFYALDCYIKTCNRRILKFLLKFCGNDNINKYPSEHENDHPAKICQIFICQTYRQVINNSREC